MRVTKSAVIQAASDIADQSGLNSVSLKIVAEKLDIRTPSLYNHIASLEELLREAAHRGMKAMYERMARAAIGSSGDEAIKAVSIEYLNYMIEHPGVYETIQWATWHGTDETAELFGNYAELLKTLIRSCHLKTEKTDEILNLLTGVLHGYTTLQLSFALKEPEKVRASLTEAIDTVLLGVRQKYE